MLGVNRVGPGYGVGPLWPSKPRAVPAHARAYLVLVRPLHLTSLRPNRAPRARLVPLSLSRVTGSFLDGTSGVYLEELHRAWEADPGSVDDSWDTFFRCVTGDPASFSSSSSSFYPGFFGQTIQVSMQLRLLVHGYLANGHLNAKLDPLGLKPREIPENLDIRSYGFTDADLDHEFFIGVWRMPGFLSDNRPVKTLREILGWLERTYCGTIGYEYMHIPDREKCNWLRDKIKSLEYRVERRKVILDRLI
ncbi:putative oxoglutarate dehydrogenase (succinyl-transferring) [Dioscorea sansibarensis]